MIFKRRGASRFTFSVRRGKIGILPYFVYLQSTVKIVVLDRVKSCEGIIIFILSSIPKGCYQYAEKILRLMLQLIFKYI